MTKFYPKDLWRGQLWGRHLVPSYPFCLQPRRGIYILSYWSILHTWKTKVDRTVIHRLDAIHLWNLSERQACDQELNGRRRAWNANHLLRTSLGVQWHISRLAYHHHLLASSTSVRRNLGKYHELKCLRVSLEHLMRNELLNITVAFFCTLFYLEC